MENKISHNIKIFVKNFTKNRTSNSLSIIGLSIGISVTTLIGWWCFNEFRHDSFHKDGESIYLVCGKGLINGGSAEVPQTFGPVAGIIKSASAEVQSSVRVVKVPGQVISIESLKSTNSTVIVDPNFFDFFTFPLLSGDTKTCLSNPKSIVVTESFLKQYSLGEDPVGTVVDYMDDSWTITAVMKDISSNSHLKFDALISIKEIPEIGDEEWYADQFITYLKIQSDSNLNEIANKITQIVVGEVPMFKDMEFEYSLMPLKDIYFKTINFKFSHLESSDIKIVLVLLFMAIAILVAASINFTNLFISTTFLRVKSMAIRRSNGAGKGIIIREIFIESALYIAISLFISLFITLISYPTFNDLLKSELLFEITDYRFILFTLAIGSIATIISATYPAISFANMDIIQALKGGYNSKRGNLTPKILIVIQLVATTIFVIAVSMVKRQVNFMITADRGFNTENTIYLSNNIASFNKSYNVIREELKRVPNIVDVTAASNLPTQWYGGYSVGIPGNDRPSIGMEFTYIKYNYAKQMGIEVLQGDDMNELDNISNTIWINETAAKALQLDNPIGQNIKIEEEIRRVKGVFKDYNAKSMHSSIGPMIFMPLEEGYSNPSLFIKFSGNPKDIIDSIEKIWKRYNVNSEFNYGFLDEEYENLYQKEKMLGVTISWGMGIALLITLFGLFAIAKFSAERRTKEIGIHIINGASSYSIVSMLSYGFLKFVLIASIIGIPIGYYISDRWLENFVNKTDISWWMLITPVLITSIITTLTVAYHARKVAHIDPIKTLKDE